jgi:membrane-bound lytic murein transglycosylase D
VRAGESLATIASKYKVSVAAIITYNKLPKKYRPVSGQRLSVPIYIAKSTTPQATTKNGDKNALRHKVQKGDTLTSVALKYDTTVTELRQANQLPSDALKIGQVLNVGKRSEQADQPPKTASPQKSREKVKAAAPPSAGQDSETKRVRKYTVRKGDSLIKIAREHNISLDKLVELNNLARKKNIQPGQVILIQ